MSERQEKKTSWLERVPTKVPLGIQTTLIATASLVLLGAITVFGSAFFVNSMTNMLVQEAREEARRTAITAVDQIRTVLTRSGARSMPEIVNHPEVRRELEILSNQGAIAVAAILDENRQVIFQQFCAGSPDQWIESELEMDLPAFAGRGTGGMANRGQTARLPTSVIPVEFPITVNDQTVGHVLIGLSAQPSVGRIEMLGNQITKSLAAMVLIVFAVLLSTIVLVYYAFRRQMDLQQRTTESEHMASVGALASGLAHEIRNPLHAMNLHLQVALEDMESNDFDPQDATNSLSRVQNQIEHLNGIVTTFLNASSPLRMEMQEVHLDRVVNELASFMQPDLDAHGIKLKVEVPAGMIVRGDSGAIRQVMLNLLLNAQQALGKVEERRIRISTERERRTLRLYVDDSGPGLPKGEEDSICRRFITKRAGGTGFGLAIARRIMEGHQGRIWATRSPLGGARLILEFPAAS